MSWVQAPLVAPRIGILLYIRMKTAERCNCEQSACEVMGMHVPSKCKNLTNGKSSLYIGPICDTCAEYLPKEFLLEATSNQGLVKQAKNSLEQVEQILAKLNKLRPHLDDEGTQLYISAMTDLQEFYYSLLPSE
jgi:hypothetical protein